MAYFERHLDMEGRISTFDNPDELLECLDKEDFEVFILDILMPQMNGIELGKKIRGRNSDAAVIFVTSSPEYAVEAFGIFAFQYLLKPVEEARLAEVLKKVWQYFYNQRCHVATIRGSESITNVVIEDVAYIENDVRKAIYVLKNGEKVTGVRRKGTFEDAVMDIVNKAPFIQTHKSFFVNMKYIRELKQDMVIMDNGTLIPINRKRLSAVKSKYVEYVSEGGRF